MGGHKKVDYSKECWNCAGNLMENKGEYVQCRSCGATWNYVPKLGPPIIFEVIDKFGFPVERHSIPIPARRRQRAKKEDLG